MIACPINFDGAPILLGCPQSLPWVGSVVDCAGRVAPSALARPSSKSCVTLAQILLKILKRFRAICARSRDQRSRGQEIPINHERWSEHSPLSMYGRGLGGGPLDAPLCTDVTLPRFALPAKGRAKVGVFLSESSFFSPWGTGVFS